VNDRLLVKIATVGKHLLYGSGVCLLFKEPCRHARIGFSAQGITDENARLDWQVKINSSFDPHTLQQVNHVFSGDIAGGTLGLRTAA
jgi:hypothetical protein